MAGEQLRDRLFEAVRGHESESALRDFIQAATMLADDHLVDKQMAELMQVSVDEVRNRRKMLLRIGGIKELGIVTSGDLCMRKRTANMRRWIANWPHCLATLCPTMPLDSKASATRAATRTISFEWSTISRSARPSNIPFAGKPVPAHVRAVLNQLKQSDTLEGVSPSRLTELVVVALKPFRGATEKLAFNFVRRAGLANPRATSECSMSSAKK